MLFSVSELAKYWNISPNGVLHVGAHLGEEASSYAQLGWSPTIWVEAQPKLVQKLRETLQPDNNRIIQAAVWGTAGLPLKLHVASNSMSSSLLDFGSHSKSYPEITYIEEVDVITQRLDSLISEVDMPNFLNIDIQGAELEAIKSLGRLLKHLDFIYVEVNRKEVYKGCTLVSELDDFLDANDFQRSATRWFFKEGWGDAIYIRRSKLHKMELHNLVSYSILNINFYAKQLLRFLGIGKIFRTLGILKK